VIGKRRLVAGASAGAPSTIQFALRHPQRTRAIVLLVPAGRAPGNAAVTPAATEFLFDTALRSDLLFWAATRIARDTTITSILATPPAQVHGASVAEQRRVGEMLDRILPVSARRLGLLNDARIVSTLAPLPLERIGTPALVISVRDDGFGTWDGSSRCCNGTSRRS
jgi:pimeloyl-ACP methyl ester carboxylesterase